jgi:tetratricopeptide (TPR) repeat protein
VRRSLVALGVLATAVGALHAAADSIVLKSGRVIQAQQAWYEGGELRYRQDGALYRLPRELVARVESADGALPLDPDVTRSRERLAAGDADEALRLARLAVFRDGASVAALQSLAAAQLALGDAPRARDSAEAALALAPRSAPLHELLGDVLAELADFSAARAQYRAALDIAPDPRLRAKLDGLVGSRGAASSARLRLQYDGGADEPLGLAVLRVLDGAWEEYRERLGFSPGQPVTVVLQTATAFRDTTRAPEWAAAWNDGTIRVPVAGLAAPTPSLVRVLRHELAHSFLASRTGANCPTWLQEGVAQWLEGSDVAREDAALARAAQRRRLDRLESLEAPFVRLSQADASRAYAISLSVVAHVLRRGGEAGLRRLIDALAAGQPAAEALPTALSMSYGELQRDWEKHLAGVKSAATPPR